VQRIGGEGVIIRWM